VHRVRGTRSTQRFGSAWQGQRRRKASIASPSRDPAQHTSDFTRGDMFVCAVRTPSDSLVGSGSVLSAVGWSCGALQAPDEGQSDEDSSDHSIDCFPQGEDPSIAPPGIQRSIDCSPRVKIPSICSPGIQRSIDCSPRVKIHRLLPQGDVQTGLFPYREKPPNNNSTQLMLHELLISPAVSARVADVALLTAY
jgi:hypothetical protein